MAQKYHDDDLLDTRALAEALNVSAPWLVQARIEGSGPPYEKYGKALNSKVRYRWGDVTTWRKNRTYTSSRDHMERTHAT